MNEKSKLDVHFIIFYIYKKYDKMELSEYYRVTPSVASKWKRYFPDARLHEFAYREGTTNIVELIQRIYE